jgi:hypothetical protein
MMQFVDVILLEAFAALQVAVTVTVLETVVLIVIGDRATPTRRSDEVAVSE